MKVKSRPAELVDVSLAAKSFGFIRRAYLTQRVWSECVEASQGNKSSTEKRRVNAILRSFRFGTIFQDGGQIRALVIRRGKGIFGLEPVVLSAHRHLDSEGREAMTLALEHERVDRLYGLKIISWEKE